MNKILKSGFSKGFNSGLISVPSIIGSPSLGGGAFAEAKAALLALFGASLNAPNPHSRGAMSPAPTITAVGAGANANPPSPYNTMTLLELASGSGANLFLEGGAPSTSDVANPFFYRPSAVSTPGAGSSNNNTNQVTWRYYTRTDQDVVAVCVAGHTNGQYAYRFGINQQYASVSPLVVNAAIGRQWVILDMTGLGIPKDADGRREIFVELARNGNVPQGSFRGFAISPSGSFAKPVSKRLCVVIGDSFSTGTGGTTVGDGFHQQMADRLGMAVWSASNGGSGYYNNDGGSDYIVSDRVDADLDRVLSTGQTPDLILFFEGVNDLGQTSGNLGPNAQLSIAKARAKCPNAIIGIGGPWNGSAPTSQSAANLTAESALRAISAATPGSFFIDTSDWAYTKNGSHPDDSGHTTLGLLGETAVRAGVPVS